MAMILRALSLASLLILATAADAAGPPTAPIHDFASDFSGGNPEILSRVGAYIDNPPTEIEEIGFYGMENESPGTRLFLATVSLLDSQDHLYSFEDKYMADLLAVWAEDGLFDPGQLPPEAQGVFRPFFDMAFVDAIYDEEGSETSPALRDYIAYLDAHYAEATLQLEAAIEESSGKTLLSVDATEGDTMFFALVEPEIAEKWLNKGFAAPREYQAGIREPMWDFFWYNLVYALQLPTVGDIYTRPLPEGTRKRREFLIPAQ